MNHELSSFYNSNLGKCIEKEGDITSVILVNESNKRCMTMKYTVYFCHNGKIEREDDELCYECIGSDEMFPQYLCNKGAVVIGNIVVDKDILSNM